LSAGKTGAPADKLIYLWLASGRVLLPFRGTNSSNGITPVPAIKKNTNVEFFLRVGRWFLRLLL